MNPNTCCGLDGATFASIDFREIPTDWSLELRGHQGPKCGPAIQFASVYRRSNICINKGPFGGGGYGFFEKRSDTSQDCHETVTPSTLAFVDGPQYNLTDLDASSLHELVRLYLTYEDEICADYCYSQLVMPFLFFSLCFLPLTFFAYPLPQIDVIS
jgi:hypothetical protein